MLPILTLQFWSQTEAFVLWSCFFTCACCSCFACETLQAGDWSPQINNLFSLQTLNIWKLPSFRVFQKKRVSFLNQVILPSASAFDGETGPSWDPASHAAHRWDQTPEKHPLEELLLMEEILHQLMYSLSHYSQGFMHSGWCRISSIKSMFLGEGANHFISVNQNNITSRTNMMYKMLYQLCIKCKPISHLFSECCFICLYIFLMIWFFHLYKC